MHSRTRKKSEAGAELRRVGTWERPSEREEGPGYAGPGTEAGLRLSPAWGGSCCLGLCTKE